MASTHIKIMEAENLVFTENQPGLCDSRPMYNITQNWIRA